MKALLRFWQARREAKGMELRKRVVLSGELFRDRGIRCSLRGVEPVRG